MMNDKHMESKFMGIYEQYHKHLYYTIYGILKNRYQSEEVLQAVFYKVARNICKIETDDGKRLKKYLEIIARNETYTLIDKLKKRYEKEISYDEFTDIIADTYDNNPFKELLMEIECKDLYDSINRLKPQEKDMLLMYYFYEYPIKNIAEIYNISYEAAKKRIQRIVKKLSEILQKDF